MPAKKEQTPLNVEIAQRMFAAAKGMPEDTPEQVRARYEAMAIASREVISERLVRYSDAVARVCLRKGHVGSTPPSGPGDTGTPCAQCRRQIRYMASATKVVSPSEGD